MIIQCVSCLKKFEVEASQIPSSGRQVKCGHCSKEWFYKPEDNLSDNQPSEIELNEIEKTIVQDSDQIINNTDDQEISDLENSDQSNAPENRDKEISSNDQNTESFANDEKSKNELGTNTDKIDYENKISKNLFGISLSKIKLGTKTNDEKRKSSLKRARHLGYVLFFLILALFIVSVPFQKNILIIFPELGLVYEGVKPIYNLLFK